jgi:transcriptional regulator GlxA family with amidase domain
MLAYPEVQILDVVGPLEIFNVATQILRNDDPDALGYKTEIVAAQAGEIQTSGGMRLVADRRLGSVRSPVDTLLVPGGTGSRKAVGDAALIGWIRRTAERANRVASVCTGTLLLAEAGLLDGQRVTTHWAYAAELARRYPKLSVDPDPVYLNNGKVYTSAGVTAGMDLALALVEEDFGREIALLVARYVVLFLRRPGGQSQFSTQLALQVADREPIRELQAWIADHLAEDLSVETLAGRSGMSPRNFSRVFTREISMTPARYVEQARVEAARLRLEDSHCTIEGVASDCGFGSAETMRRAFQRHVRVAPAEYRSRFQAA